MIQWAVRLAQYFWRISWVVSRMWLEIEGGVIS
jgi:hypothetical protein